MAFTIPNSQWSFDNYSLVEGFPTEEMSNLGPTAVAQFFGPSQNRWQFIESLFGRWVFDEVTCRYSCDPAPCPYLVQDLTADPTGQEFAACLWPDSYTIRPFELADPNVAVVNTTIRTTWDECTGLPLDERMQPCPAFSYDCASLIEVRYRHKWHAQWPSFLLPSTHSGGPTSCFDGCLDPDPEPGECGSYCYDPVIPDCTFLDVNVRPETEVITIPGRDLRFFASGDQLDEDRDVPIPITTHTYEVIWSNVPAPNWTEILKRSGSINSEVFLCYPPDAVLFYLAEVREKMTHYCQPVYDLKFIFVAKTVQMDSICEQAPPNATTCVPCNTLGIWNRAIARKPVVILPQTLGQVCLTREYNEGVPNFDDCDTPCRTHWDLVTYIEDCTGNIEGPFNRVDFDPIFTFHGATI